MANCGCKPCSKPLPNKTKNCKPFTMCVGNKTFVWDGDCAYIQDREFQIPDGTYTSITFTNGCITGVGQAPIQQYTPQACCGEDEVKNQGDTNGLEVSNVLGNLANIQNGVLSVTPVWNANGNVEVTGLGTADRPWKVGVKISKKPGNTLVEETDGLFANLFFNSTDTVEVTGVGTKANPYRLDVKGADAKLPIINKTEIEGNGFTIDTFGRWKTDSDLSLVTNLKFDHKAFTIVNQGVSTLIMVDDQLLRTGASLKVGTGLTGEGTTASPLALQLDAATVGAILTVIQNDNTLKQRLKTILGV